MITIRCLGHIATALGSSDVEMDLPEANGEKIVEYLRGMVHAGDPGFSKYNTLMLVGDGEAYVPASSDRVVTAGEKVVLIPFSHGG